MALFTGTPLMTACSLPGQRRLCAASAQLGGVSSVSGPARARVDTLLLSFGQAGGAAADAQLQALQDRLVESTQTNQALRLVAEQLSEEALLSSTSSQAALDAQLDKFAALLAHTRVLELELAERPTADDLIALQVATASSLAASQDAVCRLERELATLPDRLVSEQVEQLTARVRVLEAQLAERPELPERRERPERPERPEQLDSDAQRPSNFPSQSGASPAVSVEDHLARIEALLSLQLPAVTRSSRGRFQMRRRRFAVTPRTLLPTGGPQPAKTAGRRHFALRRHVFSRTV